MTTLIVFDDILRILNTRLNQAKSDRKNFHRKEAYSIFDGNSSPLLKEVQAGELIRIHPSMFRSSEEVSNQVPLISGIQAGALPFQVFGLHGSSTTKKKKDLFSPRAWFHSIEDSWTG